MTPLRRERLARAPGSRRSRKIGDLDLVIGQHEYVGGLKVAVNDALLVRIIKSPRDTSKKDVRLLGRESLP